MSVPVRGTLRAPKTTREAESLFAQIGARLIAFEKAVRGGAGDEILSPEVSPLGPGSGTNVTNVTNVVEGETDHGELLGLADDDHPQYVQRLEGVKLHAHGPDDVVGLEQRFYRRGESAPALPHVHSPDELGLDSRFYRRGERVPPEAHPQRMADVIDLRADDESFVLAARIFGG